MATRPGWRLLDKVTKVCAMCKYYEPYEGGDLILPSKTLSGRYEIKKGVRGRCINRHTNNKLADSPKCYYFLQS